MSELSNPNLPNRRLDKKSLFLIGFLFFLLLSWKTTRLIILDFGFIWHLHVYVTSFLAIFSIFYFKYCNYLTRIEFVFICYIFFIATSIAINIISPNTKFIFDFLLTPLIFFVAMYVGRKMSDYSFLYIFHTISALLLGFMVFEFISANYLESSYIFYGDWHDLGEDINFTRTRDMGGTFLLKAFGMQKTIRIMGVDFSVHASASLISAFAIYHLNTRMQNASFFHLLMGVLYTALLFVNGVGTSILVFIALFFVMQRRKSVLIFLFPFIIYLIILVFIERDVALYINHFPDYSVLIGDSFMKLFFFGDNQVTPHTVSTEFRMLAKPFAMGLFAFTFFHILLYLVYKSVRKIKSFRINYTPIWLFVLSIYLSSYHYNTTFIFPNSFFIFSLMGFIAGRYRLLYDQHRKNWGNIKSKKIDV